MASRFHEDGIGSIGGIDVPVAVNYDSTDANSRHRD